MTIRRALVTGGSRGIGLAVARRLRAEGLTVLTPSRSEMDLLSDASIDAWVAALAGPVDILVNNAGINIVAPAVSVTDDDLRRTLRVNLVAPFRLARALAPAMADRGWGRILTMSSIWGVVSKSGRCAYSMSKAGVLGMTRALAVELAPHGVLVNALAPGFTNTELTRQNNTPAQIAAILQTIPLGRLAEVDEIAEVAAFIVSERNTCVTGQVIVADGGYSSQ